jgi:hypothetical protein
MIDHRYVSDLIMVLISFSMTYIERYMVQAADHRSRYQYSIILEVFFYSKYCYPPSLWPN